jgi:protein-tyrosine-phosphatase
MDLTQIARPVRQDHQSRERHVSSLGVQVSVEELIDELAKEIGRLFKENKMLHLANTQTQRELAQARELLLQLDRDNIDMRAQLAQREDSNGDGV